MPACLSLAPNPLCRLVYADCKLSIPLCSMDNLQFLFSFSSPPRPRGHASRVGIAASYRNAFSFPSGCSLPRFQTTGWFSQNCKLSLPLRSLDNLQFQFSFSPNPRSCSHASIVGIAASPRNAFSIPSVCFLFRIPARNNEIFLHKGITSSPKSAYILRAFFSHNVIPQAG